MTSLFMIFTVALAAPVDPLPIRAGTRTMAIDEYCSDHLSSRICGGTSDQEDPEVVAIGEGEFGQVVLLADANYATYLSEQEKRYAERVDLLFGQRELSDEAMLRELLGASEAGYPSERRANHVLTTQACGNPPTDEVSDGQSGCKLVFGSDSRTVVSNADVAYPFTKYAQVTMGRFRNDGAFERTCSGFFVDDRYLVTAAHCVYDTNDNHWIYANPSNDAVLPDAVTTPLGQDRGRGYVCLAGWVDDGAEFGAKCDFVQSRWVQTGFISASDANSIAAAKWDVALLHLRADNNPDGLGAGNWVAMSSITSPATLESKLAVSYGYPAIAPSGISNAQERDWYVSGTYSGGGYTGWSTQEWQIWGCRQYKTFGIVDIPTTSDILRTKLETSGGQSGSAIIYYSNNDHDYTGQAHYVIGVLALTEVDNNGSTSNDHTIGPTVAQFRSWVLGFLP